MGLWLGCAPGEGTEAEEVPLEDAVRIDTSSPAARAQYDANVALALRYTGRCATPRMGRKRVLVTGFGRFLDNPTNATGRMVSMLAPSARYPMTVRPPAGQVDLPEAQLSVGASTVMLDQTGLIDLCAMILPVYWDLAAVLVIKEIETFAPDLVLMNGIAGTQQDLWIELGSVNRAMTLRDGSDVLQPVVAAGQQFAPIVPSAALSDRTLGTLMSWDAVRAGARAAVARHALRSERGVALGQVLTGARLAGFPRDGNTYLCNNITYAVNYAMSYPQRTFTLLQASVARRGAINRVPVVLRRDMRTTPRTFMHWPSRLEGAHLDAARQVLLSVMDAQLMAQQRASEAPTRGSNQRAELAASGDTF
jgi:pyrrolidone-carboxylate peptidase